MLSRKAPEGKWQKLWDTGICLFFSLSFSNSWRRQRFKGKDSSFLVFSVKCGETRFYSESRFSEVSSKEFSKLVDLKADQFSIFEDLFFLPGTCSWADQYHGITMQSALRFLSQWGAGMIQKVGKKKGGGEGIKIWQQRCQKCTDAHTYSAGSLRASSIWCSNSATTWPGKSRVTCKLLVHPPQASSCRLVHTGQSAPHTLTERK